METRLAVGVMQDGFDSSRTCIIVQGGLESKCNAVVPDHLTSTSTLAHVSSGGEAQTTY